MYANCFDMDNREVIKIILNAGDILTIGEGGLKQIKYHNPSGEGDKHYCDCYYEDGTVIRVFDVVHMYCSVEIKVEDKYKDLQCPF
jgi:hypothetical protein